MNELLSNIEELENTLKSNNIPDVLRPIMNEKYRKLKAELDLITNEIEVIF